MIEAVEFQNFRVLRAATLPLGPFTLIVGPNGSGKSAALTGLRLVAGKQPIDFPRSLSIGAGPPGTAKIRIAVKWDVSGQAAWTIREWPGPHGATGTEEYIPSNKLEAFRRHLNKQRHFALDARKIAEPVQLQPEMELSPEGHNLAGVLDRLRDTHPERFEGLNAELSRWLPEYDRILFDTPSAGMRGFLLRTKRTGVPIAASELSEGTLHAMALLTLASLPDPPTILTLEEPDRGIHPRLLREVQDALYRLAYPQQFGESRPPVQVIATTHAPYFLDLYRDQPEEVVIAQKNGLEATFQRLSDLPDVEEILNGTSLGDVWYSGILGGVPVGT